VRLGSQLEIAYFDQLRAELDEQLTPVDIVGQGHEVVMQNGRARHVIGYLQDFLFEPAQARAPVKALSGGERNRLLLAKLFAQPANVLVLDEPTNDLDVETLEILETLLVEYTGTLILVSHDRDFLDHVVTSCIAFEGNGLLAEYAGGYDDYLRQRPLEPAQSQPPVKARPQPAAPPSKPQRKRLSYKEEQERQALPARIEALEAEQAEISRRLAEPDFYQQPAAQINQINTRLKSLADELQIAYARWEALESLAEE
jgi:ATP-binding cassette subfamily F protein uup